MSKAIRQIKKHRLMKVEDSLQVLIDKVCGQRTDEKIEDTLRYTQYRASKFNEVKRLKH